LKANITVFSRKHKIQSKFFWKRRRVGISSQKNTIEKGWHRTRTDFICERRICARNIY